MSEFPIFAEAEACIKEFYAIQSLGVLVKPEPFRHSHERWKRDFNQYKNHYTKKLAQAMFDYSTLVCFGEMRHGGSHGRFYNIHVPCENGRNVAYLNAKRQYTPISILKAAISLFDCGSWESGYGGWSWKQIAEVALNRAEGRRGWSVDEVFIDRCVDLSHNSSIYFDKEDSGIFWLLDPYTYKQFLDFKRYASPESIIAGYPHSQQFDNLHQRALNLGIIDNGICPCTYQGQQIFIDFILGYSPISWGNRYLPDEIEENENWDGREEDDDYCEEDVYEEEGEEETNYWEEEYEHEEWIICAR